MTTREEYRSRLAAFTVQVERMRPRNPDLADRLMESYLRGLVDAGYVPSPGDTFMIDAYVASKLSGMPIVEAMAQLAKVIPGQYIEFLNEHRRQYEAMQQEH